MIRQVEFADAQYGPRTLSIPMFYPAAIDESSAKPFAHSHNYAVVPIYEVRTNQQGKERYAEMNSENDDTDDINNDILWFETEAAAFIGAPASGSTAGLPARVVERIRRRAKPDRLIENFILGFFRNGVRVAFYLACAYVAKIAFGLSLALR